MLVEIPLTDEERAAVESDQRAVVRLIDLLADVATPAGPTPRQITATADPAHPDLETELTGRALTIAQTCQCYPSRTRLTARGIAGTAGQR